MLGDVIRLPSQNRWVGYEPTGEITMYTPFEDLPTVLTVDELAAFLRVAPSTIYNGINKEEIPLVPVVGEARRIPKRAVAAWLKGKTTD